jgi:cytochrome c oxidase assembly protein subunit 15
MSVASTVGARCRSLRTRIGLGHLLATTLGLVAATILLGVAAKATGSGLACQANWPQCDTGPWNLFPASLPSFYEWIHRFVAMFAGVAIIASAAAVALSSVRRRVATLVLAGTALTPVQVYLGRQTVLQYELQVLSVHFWTAMSIFVAFTLATALVWADRLRPAHRTAALAVGVGALVGHVALSPAAGLIGAYTPTAQLGQYAVALALLGATILAALLGRWHAEKRLARLLPGTVVLALAVAYLGRQTVATPAIDRLYLVTAAVLGVALVLAVRSSRAATRPTAL